MNNGKPTSNEPVCATDAAAKSSALSDGPEQPYRRRKIIFSEGDAAEDLFVVVQGRVKLVARQPSGKETILNIVEDGGILCSGAVWQGRTHCCTAMSDDDNTVVRTISRNDVCAAIGDASSTAFALLDAATKRNTELCARIRQTTQGTVDQRLASMLLTMADECGVHTDDGRLVPRRLARQDLADLVGTSIESAIRAMRRLEQALLVESRTDGFLLRDIAGLKRVLRGRTGSGARR